MLRYLIVCLLLAPQIFADEDCVYDWLQCMSSNRSLNCNEEVNPGWIKRHRVCDGAKDCDDGSDEFLSLCKLHPSEMSENYFYCASGGVIAMNQECDNVTDCLDASDELECGNEPMDDTKKDQSGSCSESQFECLPGECIELSKLCDHRIDCTNGRDESLQQCIKQCETNELQCGYGSCISANKICDNHIDCLDGADELPTVCSEVERHIPIHYGNCSDPKIRHLSLADDTKYHLDAKGDKYFFAQRTSPFQMRVLY